MVDIEEKSTKGEDKKMELLNPLSKTSLRREFISSCCLFKVWFY